MRTDFPKSPQLRLGWLVVSIGTVCLPLALAILSTSCVTSGREVKPKTPSPIVWPTPPDAPRISWLRNISTPGDVGMTPSTWNKVVGFVTGESPEHQNLDKPFGITVDETGTVYVTDTGNNSVICLDLNHKEWRRWRTAGKTRFLAPVSLARRQGVFYVADSELAQVLAFNDKGDEIFTVSKPLQRPTGVALNGELLFVVDSQLHAVLAFDLGGKLKFQFGTRGTAPGEFNYPTHINSDSAGHLLVTDAMNSRVQVFDAKGTFISQIGKAGDVPGHFGRPKGVAVDGFGHVYVVDAMFDNIQIFDLSGKLLLNFGEGGTKPGQFGVPAGIAVGPDNKIYVADSYNHRVQVFQYIGAP